MNAPRVKPRCSLRDAHRRMCNLAAEHAGPHVAAPYSVPGHCPDCFAMLPNDGTCCDECDWVQPVDGDALDMFARRGSASQRALDDLTRRAEPGLLEHERERIQWLDDALTLALVDGVVVELRYAAPGNVSTFACRVRHPFGGSYVGCAAKPLDALRVGLEELARARVFK